MKYLIGLTAGLCLLFASVPAIANQAEDESAIRKFRAQVINAWNTKDLETIEDLYPDDPEVWDGRKLSAVIETVPALFESAWKEFHIKQLEEIGIIFVTPDVAVFKSRQMYSGTFDEQGEVIPPMEVLYAEVFVKRDGKWMGHSWFWSQTDE